MTTAIDSHSTVKQEKWAAGNPGSWSQPAPCQVIGFFPGLGSRGFYRDAGGTLLDRAAPEALDIFHEAAEAYGVIDGDPNKILLMADNIPKATLEKQSFIGAAFLAHSLALEANLRAAARANDLELKITAYTGESFGILASAVASGAVSTWDGIRIARAFTPLMLMAGEGKPGGEPIGRELGRHLPTFAPGQEPVGEPFQVVGLTGQPEFLEHVIRELSRTFHPAQVEVHKRYSRSQVNTYVALSAANLFRDFVQLFPSITLTDLKAPTRFLAHSARMTPARESLERLMDDERIIFRTPHTPVISNHDAGLLTTAEQVRDGVLSMTDKIMASQRTVEMIDEMQADIVLELGLGGKSLRLLSDNTIETPAGMYTGVVDEEASLLDGLEVASVLKSTLPNLNEKRSDFGPQHLELLRQVFRLSSASDFHERHFSRIMRRVIRSIVLKPEAIAPQPLLRFIEVFQHTKTHGAALDRVAGELIVNARVKKRLTGSGKEVGHACTEIEVLDRAGTVVAQIVPEVESAEVVVFHFALPEGRHDVEWARRVRRLLESQPTTQESYRELVAELWEVAASSEGTRDRQLLAADQSAAIDLLVYQHAMFDLIKLFRPALLAQTDYYVLGRDRIGWLVALAVSGAIRLVDAVELAAASLSPNLRPEMMRPLLKRLLRTVGRSDVPVISPAGTPLRTKKDLQAATEAVFLAGALDGPTRSIKLNGVCQILSLGSELYADHLSTHPHSATVVPVLVASDIWKKRANVALHDADERALLASTHERGRVLDYARGRKLLSSAIYAYVHPGETIVGFGAGGSESMTIFIKREDDDDIVVRKVLSDALTTVSWNPDGKGVMLPPFAKAKKQAEYLQALPASVSSTFPRVGHVEERVIPVPSHLRSSPDQGYNEVIYEMTFVPGEEVSRFVEKNVPPPAVLARLYEQIFLVLHRDVHTINRNAVTDATLEEQYFAKIENRLDLCRKTAPRTFGPDLLDSHLIVIDGVSYLNHRELLRRFRDNPLYESVLEPRFHSLVMGDTNTENIKVANTQPLVEAQALIEKGASQPTIDYALAAITPESIGLMFLDPRAIGFRSDGATTRDDPMYDNKPWHNSIGHYDEIHFEQFRLLVATEPGATPRIDIDFLEGNPYQRAYRVRDVTASGEHLDPAAPKQGMEDYFAQVMSAVYGLQDPHSQQLQDDPYWLVRFVFIMGTHFAAMPPFHFQSELDGTLIDTPQTQRRPVAIYCEGIKWLNWSLQMLEGTRTEFLGLPVPPLPQGRSGTTDSTAPSAA